MRPGLEAFSADQMALGAGGGGAAQVIQADVAIFALLSQNLMCGVFASLLPETRERAFWFEAL